MAKKYHGEKKDMKNKVEHKKMMPGHDFANLPQEKMMKDYPKAEYGINGYNDTREGIDMLAKDNHKQLQKQKVPRY